MYEDMTYEVILNRMLSRVPDTLDKREGSMIYDALSPAAAELCQMYMELDVVLNETFANTASRAYLAKRAAERGLTPYPAVQAVVKGVFNTAVPLGSRFLLDGVVYRVTELISDVEHSYQMVCETAGSAVNHLRGRLLPLDYIEGLSRAALTELLIPGEDEEDTEVFRARYIRSLNAQAFGGNVADYQEKVNALPGVGGVKVYPVHAGGGTVRLVIISSEFGPASAELVDAVQTAVDPVSNAGEGLGLAPVGHVVTVESVQETVVDMVFSLTLTADWSWEDVEGYVRQTAADYFTELSEDWAEAEQLIVRISQLESRILELPGVVDVQNTTLNGAASNLVLSEDAVPVAGVIQNV